VSQGQVTLFHYVREFVRLAFLAGVEEAMNDSIFPNPAETQTAKEVKARIGRLGARQLTLPPGSETPASDSGKNAEAAAANDGRRTSPRTRKDESPAKEDGQ
jgi:hypothetical protein